MFVIWQLWLWREPAELDVHAKVAGPALGPHPYPPPGGTGHRRGPTKPTADWQQEGQEIYPHYLVRSAYITDTGYKVTDLFRRCIKEVKNFVPIIKNVHRLVLNRPLANLKWCLYNLVCSSSWVFVLDIFFVHVFSKSPVPLNYRGGMLEIHDSIALKSRKNLSLAITKVRERCKAKKAFIAILCHCHTFLGSRISAMFQF